MALPGGRCSSRDGDEDRIRFVQPASFPRPRGYANGVVSRGRTLRVAGQIGWELDGSFASDELPFQFGRALDHVIAVVRAAGGEPTDIVELTIYVTDLPAYRSSLPAIGAAWRERLGKHFPAMALLGVAGLVEPRAKVEIQAVASLPDEDLDEEDA
jgi:enamine deaminase RidA (YjgF/YER057c/UK114 family)